MQNQQCGHIHVGAGRPGGLLKLDFGFEPSMYGLSPQLMTNRVVRNQFVIHPQFTLDSGWRLRALAEIEALSLALDLGLGAGHAMEHGSGFGHWGRSGHPASFLTWTIGDSRQLSV